MKEQLYTIPVNDAFAVDCECPVCSMYDSLEKDAIEFTMGPSYMEDDIRMETNKIGFCTHHVKQLYKHQNRLGLALILHTHMQRTNRDLEDLLSSDKPVKKGLFAKKTENASPVTEYIENLNHSCYICNRIDRIFARYLANPSITAMSMTRSSAGSLLLQRAFARSISVCFTRVHRQVFPASAYRSLSRL